jgi:hypothetical protein
MHFIKTSVADPGCLSRIQKQEQKRGVKKISCHTHLFWSHKFPKIVNYFTFEMPKKKIWANFQRIIELFTPKIVIKLSKIWVWDPRSGIRDPGSEIRDPRSGIRDPGSEIRDPGSEIRDPRSGIRDPGSRKNLSRIFQKLNLKKNFASFQFDVINLHLSSCLLV